MRHFGVRLQLLLTVLVVLLATAASDRSQYFCKMMGRTVAECCCSGEQRQQRSRSVTAKSADCCELLTASSQPLVISHNAAVPELPVAALAATLPAFVYREQSFRLVPVPHAPARAPPAIGPPLFISNCALLI